MSKIEEIRDEIKNIKTNYDVKQLHIIHRI